MVSKPTHRGQPGVSENDPPPKPKITLRPMKLSDCAHLGRMATAAYANTSVERFLSPLAYKYPNDLIRGHKQAIRRRLLNPYSYSVVACLSEEPQTAVGFGQFARLGDDVGAREYVKSHGLLQRGWMWVLAWFFHFFVKVENWMFPAKAFDNDALAALGKWNVEDSKIHWDSAAHPERQSRWVAATLIVDPKFQNSGIGRKIMESGMAIAQRETTIMGLIASPAGERLYLKLAFEKLGDFCHRIPDDEEEGGGVFIWYPEGWVGERDAKADEG